MEGRKMSSKETLKHWKLRLKEWRYRRWWKRNYPEAFHTFDWDEHPEDWDDGCICHTCRSYMSGE